MRIKGKKNTKNGLHLFWMIILLALLAFIGYDYIKLYFVNHSPKYTVGIVTDFKQYAREGDNKINYFYFVKGEKYSDDYQNNRLPLNLKGKHILIKYSEKAPFWNVPFYDNVLPDSLVAPAKGWNQPPN